MPRKPLPLGTWGRVSRMEIAPGRWRSLARFRDFDGRTRQVEAWGKTGAAAERALVSAMTDRAAPAVDTITSETRLAVVGRIWLAEVARSDLATNTQSRYGDLVNNHVVPGIGGLQVREATVGTLDRFIRTINDRVGAATAKGCRVVLAAMLGLAARHDAAPRNVVRDTSAVPQEHKAVRVLTEREVRALRATLAADRVTARADLPDVIDFMLGTGVRIGEALAFRWADIDLGSAIATATVTGTVVRVPGQGLTIQDHPKTASGRRRLMLPPFIVSMLMRRQLDMIEQNPWDLVFPSSTGTLREPQNVHRQWRAARGRAGMDWITPHVFRKSVATVIGLGDVRAAADQLGHSGTAVTERHYLAKTHQGPDARALLEVFGQPADGQDERGV